MESNSTNNTSLSLANSLYKEAEKFKNTMVKGKAYVEKIDNDAIYNEYKDMDDLAFENMKYSEDLDEEQKETLKRYEAYKKMSGQRAELVDALKDAEETKKSYTKNIHIAISKYIVEAEKEIANIKKQLDAYEKYIEQEKAKVSDLEAEIKLLEEDPEKNNLVIEDKKAELELLKTSIADKEKRLKSFNKALDKLEKELESNKVKFADYLELADEDIELEEKESPNKGDEKEVPAEEEKVSPDKGDEKEVPAEEGEKGSQNKGAGKEAPAEGGKTSQEKGEEKSVAEKVEKEQPKETDAQAFNRIYKLMKSRKTRDSISKEDIDRMMDIMSDPQKYKEFKIDTSRFLKLPFFPSTAEKVFKQIGRHLDKDVKTTLGVHAVQELVGNNELTKWESVTDLGYNQERQTMAEALIEDAVLNENTSEEEVEKLMEMQMRLDKFHEAATAMYKVRMSRNELKVPTNMLGEAQEQKAIPDEEAYEAALNDKEVNREEPDVLDYSDNKDYQAFMENRPPWGELVPPEDVDMEIYNGNSGAREAHNDREEI